MREIRFRAWDKLNNRMSSTNISIDFVNQMCHFFDEEFRGNPTFITDFIPMQYTGLKDKNGVEIYEGDIVDVRSYTVNGLGKVGFHKGSFVFNKFEYPASQVLHSFAEIEIIGNIYEHSHLLDNN